MSKNRLSFFIQFLLMTVTLVSCQKESLINQPASASFNNLRVKTKSEGNKTEHYTYDAQNRVSRIDFTENGNTYFYTYTYQLDKVIEYRSNEPVRAEEEILPDGSIRLNCGSNPRTYTLNTSGYYIGTSTLCEQQLFSYDESGFITEQNYNISHYNRRQELKNDGKNIIIYKEPQIKNNELVLWYIDINTPDGYMNCHPIWLFDLKFGDNFMKQHKINFIK
ncbi:MAG TPA: hypothetical protein PLA16_11345, partial [Chitinophagales bacterium]|nr:hypothetical protein [Chitinophagales bacterium]